jgi:hypothetical protein
MLQDGSLKQLAATLTNRGATKSDFEKLAELLQEALRTNAPPTQVAATIHTETPFSGLGDALLSTKGVAVATWLTVVLTVVVLIIPSLAKDPRLW